MKCPVHVCVEMELVPMRAPSFVFVGNGDSEVSRSRDSRKAWKCPVSGCLRVCQTSEGDADPRAARTCRKCGVAIDGERRYRICRDCVTARVYERARLRSGATTAAAARGGAPA